MLETIKVIYQHPVLERPDWAIPTLIIAAILMLLFYVAMKFTEGDWNILATMGFMFAGFILAFGASGFAARVPSERMEYTVYVSWDQDLSVFNDYDIIKKDGAVWTIQDKKD